jgi:CheY-like chemotaxis protein
VPNDLLGDPLRLRQVLNNLLANALKFTDRGRIAVEVTRAGFGETLNHLSILGDTDGLPASVPTAPEQSSATMQSSGTVDSAQAEAAVLQDFNKTTLAKVAEHRISLRFSVVDSGIGISRENQERIFAPFAQVDTSSTRRHGGVGLGLAIASDLIHAMGGQLAVNSEVGCGSTFWFAIALPVVVRSAEKSGSYATGSLKDSAKDTTMSNGGTERSSEKLQVLLAEDMRANQMLVLYALRQRGHRVDVAGDGQEAVERATASAYDVILMDVQMPVLDGFQATAAIRALPSRARVPIIALTAHAMAGDRERCLEAGMNGYLAKPLDIEQLIDVVETWGRQPLDNDYTCNHSG